MDSGEQSRHGENANLWLWISIAAKKMQSGEKKLGFSGI